MATIPNNSGDPVKDMEDEVDDIDILDQWARKRAKAITDKANAHILSGKGYPSQRLLGQHETYMAIRSFIAGMKRQNPLKK